MKTNNLLLPLCITFLCIVAAQARAGGPVESLVESDILRRSELVYEKGPAKIYRISTDEHLESVLPEQSILKSLQSSQEYPNVIILNAEVDGIKKGEPNQWLIFDSTRHAKFYALYLQYEKSPITITVYVGGKKYKAINKVQDYGVYLFELNGPKYKKGIYPCTITLKLKKDKTGVGETCVFWVVPAP